MKKKYGWKDLGYDLFTGGINGAAAPLTNALGGAAGTTVMKLLGQEALETTVKSGALLAAKTAGKEVIEEVIEEGVEQLGKSTFKTLLAKGLSFTANSMVDGGLSGFVDGSSRAFAEGRYEDILSDGIEGLQGGLIASPIMGAGFNLAGKAGSKLGQTAFGKALGNVTKEGMQALGGAIDNILPQGVKRVIHESGEKLNNRFIQTSLKNCLTISDDGIYSVKTNGYNVQLIEDELSEEILEAISKGDNTLVFNYANEVLAQELSKNTADAVANEIINTQKIASSIEEQIQERINKLDYADEFDADDISDLVKGIEYAKERLQASNIEFSEEDILDIMEAGEYFDPSQIFTTLTSMSNVKDIGKAYMLSQLIKQGVLSKESLMEITDGFSASDSFGKAFCDNLSHNSNYFTTILKTCGFDEEKIAELVNISKMIADGDIATSDLKEIMPNIATMAPEELRNFTSPDKGLNKDIDNLADGKPISNLSDDIAQKLHAINCNEEQLAKIKDLEKKQLKVFETCLKDSNVEVLLRDGILKIDDIIDLNYYMNVPGFGEMPIPAGKKQAKQFIKALKDENILNLLKNNLINTEDIMKIIDYPASSSIRGYSFDDIMRALQNEKAINLVSETSLELSSVRYVNKLTDIQIENLYSMLNSSSNLDFDVKIVKLQNDAGYEIKATTKKYYDSNFKTNISFEYTIGANGEQRCARVENYSTTDEILTRYKNSKNSILLKEHDKSGKLSESIELILNDDGEPIEIMNTKATSEDLAGTYRTVKYNLADYPEDMDVIEAIKSGDISGGEILTETVRNNDGSVTYKERYNTDNITTNRTYTQKLSESGEILSNQYQYQIVDVNDNSLMQIERSWVKNSDGSTTTTVNGKTYVANFDETSNTITITHENGQVETINMSKKQLSESFSKLLLLLGRKIDSTSVGQEELWNLYKTLPADSLLNLNKYIKKVGKVDDLESAYIHIGHILTTGTESSILNHELGHSIDFSNKKQFSHNQQLIAIYNEEMNNFKNNVPPEMQSIIEYFSQNGGSQGAFNISKGDTGLNEFIAETNSILTTYGHNTDLISARAMYITRYFPKTIAKIAELLGYSN